MTGSSRIRALVFLASFALASGALAAGPSAAVGASEKGSRASPQSVVTDFNRDGFADLAIGVPFEDVGSVVDAGAVHVLYGSAAGLQATVPDDQLWSQNSAGVDDVAEQFDRFGWSVAAGDFNGDGYADLGVGVPLET